LAVFSQAVLAELPSFYGENFARRGSEWSDASARKPQSTPQNLLSTSKDAYQRQISDFESLGGPYADTLAEPLLGLGRYYAGRGDYDHAVGLFRRALHVVRLNDGLYSEVQAPIVRELLDTIRDKGDLRALDDRYNYFFRLYGNGQPPHTEIRMRASLEYLRWQREALRLGIDGRDNRRLLKAYTLSESLLGSGGLYGYNAAEDQWMLSLGQIRNLYLLQSRVSPRIVVSSKGSLFQAVAAQEGELDFEQRHLESIQRNAQERGRQVLEQFLAVSPATVTDDHLASAEPSMQARALLELGDWHQWNGSYRRASGYYARVEQILSEAGEGELWQSWFGSPVELPDNGAFWQPPAIVEGGERVLVKATYDVSARGRITNISVENASPEDRGKAYGFRRELGRTRFRPRYENGQAVATGQLQREYELYD
jgi:tetratricopeptide (TPR) repeat protein